MSNAVSAPGTYELPDGSEAVIDHHPGFVLLSRLIDGVPVWGQSFTYGSLERVLDKMRENPDGFFALHWHNREDGTRMTPEEILGLQQHEPLPPVEVPPARPLNDRILAAISATGIKPPQWGVLTVPARGASTFEPIDLPVDAAPIVERQQAENPTARVFTIVGYRKEVIVREDDVVGRPPIFVPVRDLPVQPENAVSQAVNAPSAADTLF